MRRVECIVCDQVFETDHNFKKKCSYECEVEFKRAYDRKRQSTLRYKKSKRAYDKNYKKNRRENDPVYKMKEAVAHRIRSAIRNKGYTKKSKTTDFLGCDYTTFKNHIESKFSKGMSWHNHGDWELDHIIPISWADNEFQIWALSYYENFQPKWRNDNKVKSNNYIG